MGIILRAKRCAAFVAAELARLLRCRLNLRRFTSKLQLPVWHVVMPGSE